LPPLTADAALLVWLLATLQPMPRTRVKELLRSGRVLVNGTSITQHDHPLAPGDRVSISRDAPSTHTPQSVGLAITFEDEAVIAIDKPSGMLTVATEGEKADTAFTRLSKLLTARRAGRPYVVHRLDRDTSGLLLFARSPLIRDRLQADWERVTKTYLAVVEGVPARPEGVIDNFLVEDLNLRVRACGRDTPGAKRAVTRYRVKMAGRKHSLIEVVLETGRKHQIRVHLAGLDCPVVGDERYGPKPDPTGRLGLHAWRLVFDHPVTGKRVELVSPLPGPLRRMIDH
jgi:23S rRNA pseudouridine1911/1915/1917 synthase